MARLGLIGAVGVVVGLVWQSANGCSCDRTPRPAAELLATYDGVFVGEVVRIDLVEDCMQIPDGRAVCSHQRDVTLRVWKSWKGVTTPFVVARTGGGDEDCGYDFKVGWRYVVFAQEETETPMTVSLCSPTVSESGQGTLIAALGRPLQIFDHKPGNERW